MNPQISDQKIDDYLMGKLSRDESKAFEIEVFGSPELLKEVQLREQMFGLIKNERETLIAGYAKQKSPEQKSAILESIRTLLQDWQIGWIYAGAAVAVLLIAILITPRLLEQESEINYPDGVYKFQGTAKYHGGIITDTELGILYPPTDTTYKTNVERLYEKYRKIGYPKVRYGQGVTISIVSPEIGQNLKTYVLFKWAVTKGDTKFSGPFRLKIMNHKGSVIDSVEVTGGQYKSGKLEPGLYFWTIEEKGEMLYSGKFFVNKPTN